MNHPLGTDQIHTSAAGGASASSVADRTAALMRPLLLCFAILAALFYGVSSIHWVMAADSVIMHYVNFLMQHGLKPYIDISDNNMPGAYYTEGIAMRLFGTGDLAWRLYDFFLLAILIASLILIAKPYDWLAGSFTGGLFLLIHAAEGPSSAVERDQMLTVMLLVGYAAIFAAARRNRPALMMIAGVAYGLAASIKPTFLPLPFVLFVYVAFVLRRRQMQVLPFLLWALTGLVMMLAVDLGYLLYHHALKAFLFSLHTVSTAYVSMGRRTTWQLLADVFPRNLRLYLLLIVLAAIALRRRGLAWTWEHGALALGVLFGVVSFFVQGKGYAYHRYTYLLPLLLLMSFILLAALRRPGAARGLALAAIAFVLLYALPRDAGSALGYTPAPNPLQVDLQHLGGTAALQDKVQCFDLTYGCFSALYHLQIVENTGFTGDLLFFSRADGAGSRYFKQMYWRLAQQDPATVLVVSNQWYGEVNNFDKLRYWPEFDAYLKRNYTLVVERRLAPGALEDTPEKFRIYVRNGTPLLAKAQALTAAGQL